MKFFKTHWFSILLIAVIAFVAFKSQLKISELEKEAIEIANQNKILELRVEASLEEIETLSIKDTVYIDSIITIKERINVKIKAVDTMSISELQSFFTERYPPEGSSN